MRINTPEVTSLVRNAFPEYNGKRISVEPFKGPMNVDSYWSGGSRDYWTIVSMESGKSLSVPENGTPFMPSVGPLQSLPVNCALVRWGRGPYESVTVYVNPENLNRLMLADSVQLTRDQEIVLSATSGLKSSYAGIKNYRLHEAAQYTGISIASWEAAKAELIAAGLLNKAGAITPDGRNAIGRKDFRNMGKISGNIPCGDCDPCCGGRPDQCAISPTPKLVTESTPT